MEKHNFNYWWGLEDTIKIKNHKYVKKATLIITWLDNCLELYVGNEIMYPKTCTGDGSSSGWWTYDITKFFQNSNEINIKGTCEIWGNGGSCIGWYQIEY
ncbi:hypothetical protein IO389_001520 [Campylobacter lari]|nr:hypothetical protein [Campylobacter lari]